MRSKKGVAFAVITVCIIITELVTIVSLWVLSSRYKFMYEEALQDKLTMQEEINSLKNGETEQNDDLPFVTGGETEQDDDLPFVTGGGTE